MSESDVPTVALGTREQLFVTLAAAAVAFFAEKYTSKGLTAVLLSRKS